ncbi:PREDICTED: uncharacterized protein LOC106108315, partial [Papilio polytes]|uniref:uncharacterized protein LOC106108315 n=1 Tax=Papilio polytes TaxID=76194 RepID=UPI000675D2F3
LHYIGADLYETLCDLLSPKTPETCSYSHNVDVLQLHLDPKPLEIAEFFKFHHRLQNEGEPVKDYLVALRKMAITCNFGTFLTTALRNQFVCGIRSQRIRDRLLESRDLTLERAVDIAAGIESALAERTHTESLEKSIQFLNVKKKMSPVSSKSGLVSTKSNKIVCYRCGGDHFANQCPMAN